MTPRSHTASHKPGNNPWDWYRLAQRLVSQNQPRAAAEAVAKSLQLAPDIGDFHALLARLFITNQQRSEALRALQNGLRRGCLHTEGWEDLAVCANLLGRQHDAGRAFAEALKRKPHDITLLCNAASNDLHLGQLEQARKRLQAVVQQRADTARAWWMLAAVSTQPEKDIAAIKTLWPTTTPPRERAYLAFALARLLEKTGQHEAAWNWAEKANRLVRKQLHHDQAHWRARRQAHFRRQQHLLTGHQQAEASHDHPCPVFIVGLPRAGSSLLESLLASHSNISALGELPDLPLALARWTNTASPEDSITVVGEDYLARVKAIHAPTSRWFTDKLPDNAQHLGYILTALPQARIIWIDKHPMAASWSLFKQLFAQGHKPWSYHLPWLGEAIALHHQHMTAWHQTMPQRIIRIHYEDLARNPGDQLDKIQDFLGLDNQSETLLASQGKAVTATASAAQVREAISTTAVDAWRTHATELAPAKLVMDAIFPGLC